MPVYVTLLPRIFSVATDNLACLCDYATENLGSYREKCWQLPRICPVYVIQLPIISVATDKCVGRYRESGLPVWFCYRECLGSYRTAGLAMCFCYRKAFQTTRNYSHAFMFYDWKHGQSQNLIMNAKRDIACSRLDTGRARTRTRTRTRAPVWTRGPGTMLLFAPRVLRSFVYGVGRSFPSPI